MDKLKLENFAKIKNSEFDINDITVFAGKPSTGKSYIMKILYAIDESLKQYENNIMNLDNILKMADDGKILTNKQLLQIKKELSNLSNLADISDLSGQISYNLKNLINSIFTNSSEISNNFIVKNSFLFFKYEQNNLKILSLNEKEKIRVNNIFVETPLILEFHKYLDRRESKTPYHIESLLNILDEDYSFTDEKQDEFIKKFTQKSNNIIDGDIKNKNGSFVFSRNNDKDYNIFNTSSGTKSIGLLQYLVTNKALKKGSVLFWEEPEVHLHPEWQIKMVDLFVELMNAGVKIIFSTHSPYIPDYLNAISQRKKFRDRVSFNLLSEVNGVVKNDILDEDNWDLLQDELLNPLKEIAWEYL